MFSFFSARHACTSIYDQKRGERTSKKQNLWATVAPQVWIPSVRLPLQSTAPCDGLLRERLNSRTNKKEGKKWEAGDDSLPAVIPSFAVWYMSANGRMSWVRVRPAICSSPRGILPGRCTALKVGGTNSRGKAGSGVFSATNNYKTKHLPSLLPLVTHCAHGRFESAFASMPWSRWK